MQVDIMLGVCNFVLQVSLILSGLCFIYMSTAAKANKSHSYIFSVVGFVALELPAQLIGFDYISSPSGKNLVSQFCMIFMILHKSTLLVTFHLCLLFYECNSISIKLDAIKELLLPK